MNLLDIEQVLRGVLKGDSSLYLVKSSALTTDITPAAQHLSKEQCIRSLFTANGDQYQLGYYISTIDTNATVGNLDWINDWGDLIRTCSLYDASTGKLYLNLCNVTYASDTMDVSYRHLNDLDLVKSLVCKDSNGNFAIRYMPTTA